MIFPRRIASKTYKSARWQCKSPPPQNIMMRFSTTDENKLLKIVVSQTTQPDVWLSALDLIDSKLGCRTFLAEYDTTGQPTAQFGGQGPASDLRRLFRQIETDGGRNVFEFLLTEAALFYPYCKICLDRGLSEKISTLPPALPESPEGGETGRNDACGDFKTLRNAPGLISPVWRSETVTVLFACIFTEHTPETIDASAATEIFRTITQAMTPGLSTFYEIEKERHESGIHQTMLTAVEGSVVLIDGAGHVLAQSETGIEALKYLDFAVLRESKLVFKNKQAESYLQSFDPASRSPAQDTALPSSAPPTGATEEPYFSTCLRGLDGALKRIVIQPVSMPDQTRATGPGHRLLIRVREMAYLPENIEQVLQDQYDLSQSEARLARNLTMSGSMNDTVAQLGITRNTAKTHLRRIYEKTGMHTQLQLARLVHKISGLF
ncbi:helix-turn-helix transcriptional regulator [Roseibium aggregatum]|uniref:Helix-turn-helix transcriptional regulator n=1 Tax=Roseibium aggregatum TaxID=187304 RepID=A0A939E9A7_9HYPH|nr:helix-turn-helix transcriptional regulator [Roseibium aggregatum]MBN9669241.1 helix-turn-helix transcriptional regulator [Roseibium aggregatum]